ncbi:MAG: ABC transporter ATP-binding protein [Planctomycetota bacterium]|nr:ABC transporter ATP-binding protein [Planctomycetota bacterium]
MSESEATLELCNVSRVYPGEPPVQAVGGVSLALDSGDFVALSGPSGSGKTTLLNLAGGLDRCDAGEVRIAGRLISSMTESEVRRFRRRNVGYIFQSLNLFPMLTVRENVEYVCLIRGDARIEGRDRADEALESVGLSDKSAAFPRHLSGGQQQRVAVARALAMRPRIILADEPTASLDSVSAQGLIELFLRINREHGTTLLFSTHDLRLVRIAARHVEMTDGRIGGIPDEGREG